MEERGLTVDDIRMALSNGEDIESRPDDAPYPARLVLGDLPRPWALPENTDDEIVIETATNSVPRSRKAA